MLNLSGRHLVNPDQIRIKLVRPIPIVTLYGSTKFEMNRLSIYGDMNF
jgi:hypothetical protein